MSAPVLHVIACAHGTHDAAGRDVIDGLRADLAALLAAEGPGAQVHEAYVDVQSPSLDEVVAALGLLGETELGLQSIPLEGVVGTVDRTHDFDRGFRPTSPRLLARVSPRPRSPRASTAKCAISCVLSRRMQSSR